MVSAITPFAVSLLVINSSALNLATLALTDSWIVGAIIYQNSRLQVAEILHLRHWGQYDS